MGLFWLKVSVFCKCVVVVFVLFCWYVSCFFNCYVIVFFGFNDIVLLISEVVLDKFLFWRVMEVKLFIVGIKLGVCEIIVL